MLRDLMRLPARVARLERRLEESIAYFAQRSPPHHFSPSVYLGDHTALTMLQGRLKMFVDTRGNDIAPHLLISGEWEPSYTGIFERLVRPGDTVLDVGAHLGVYALLGSRAVGPTGRLHAFEPNPRYAALLERSLAVNGFGQSKVHNAAVGAADGMAELVFSWGWGGGGHISVGQVPAGSQSRACQVVALDSLFDDADFRVDMVKMDVEGTETRALRGMSRLLARSPNAKVMFEFAPEMLAAQGSSARELVAAFGDLGFRFFQMDAALTPVDSEVLAATTDGVQNFLAARERPAL